MHHKPKCIDAQKKLGGMFEQTRHGLKDRVGIPLGPRVLLKVNFIQGNIG